jgi:hypothetical protein
MRVHFTGRPAEFSLVSEGACFMFEHEDTQKIGLKIKPAGSSGTHRILVLWASAGYFVPYVLWLPRALPTSVHLRPAVRIDLAQSSIAKIGGFEGRPGMVASTVDRQLLAAQDDNPDDTVLVDVVNGQCFKQPPSLATWFSDWRLVEDRSDKPVELFAFNSQPNN